MKPSIMALGLMLICFTHARADCAIVCWGENLYNQCNVPEPNNCFAAVGVGEGYSVGLKEDSTVICWGAWSYSLESNNGITAISVGMDHILALNSDGTIVAWGNNDWGQCTVPEPNEGYTAIAAGGIVSVSDEAAGFSLALKEDGSVVAWGDNSFGQCNVPEPNSDFIAIAAGGTHCLGLKADGSIIGWGSNCYGECDVPEPNADFIAIDAGTGIYQYIPYVPASHSLGLKADGSVVAWGCNENGECNISEPNEGYISIAAGSHYSLGLKEDSSIVSWGMNDFGQCDVPEPNQHYISVTAGDDHSAALQVIITGIEDEAALPRSLVIESLSPNPFSSVTTVLFKLPSSGPVTLKIYDHSGKLVDTLFDGTTCAGEHSVSFNGTDLPSGVYLVRVQFESENATARAVLIR